MNKEKEFYYTNEQMVKDLITITPISGSVLDAGSGKNKVWFNNLRGEKYECEIEDGCDFYKWDKKVDEMKNTKEMFENEGTDFTAGYEQALEEVKPIIEKEIKMILEKAEQAKDIKKFIKEFLNT